MPQLISPSITQPTQSVLGKSDNFKVKYVIDGDTIVLENGRKVRYLGINSPEKGQPFYQEAKTSNEQMVLNKVMRLEFDVEQSDRYGRLLAYVYYGNTMINAEQVKKGLAVVETIPPNVKYSNLFSSSQKSARDSCQGIWKGLCNTSTSENCLKIPSIHYNSAGDDTKNKNDEYIIIENRCNKTISLKDYLLKDSSASNSYIFPPFSLNSGERVNIHSGCGQDTATDLYWKCPEQKNTIWNNDTDHAYLYSDTRILVADFGY